MSTIRVSTTKTVTVPEGTDLTKLGPWEVDELARFCPDTATKQAAKREQERRREEQKERARTWMARKEVFRVELVELCKKHQIDLEVDDESINATDAPDPSAIRFYF